MFEVNKDKCIGCCKCVKDCPIGDIEINDDKAFIKNKACFKCGHCIAICPVGAVYTDDYDMNEVKEFNKDEDNIEAERLLNFIKQRRSIRKFKETPVEKEKIETIIEAGRFTATSSNSQDVSFTVIDKNLDRIRDLTYDVLRKKGEEVLTNPQNFNSNVQRYANLWVNMYERFKEDRVNNDRLFFNAPTVIVVSAEHDIDGGLASSNMELMTNALGLGTCFIGFFIRAAVDNKELLELLQIKENKKIISCMVIGYPDRKYMRNAPRKKADITWI